MARPTIQPGSPDGEWYALSVKQPWAALLVSSVKTIEIRRWPTAVRGPVLIHAARIPDDRPVAWEWVTDEIRPLAELRGGIIGAGELLSCSTYRDVASFQTDHERHLNEAEWFIPPRLFGFTFRDLRVVPFQPCRGWVRFFRVPFPLPMREETSGESAPELS